MLRLVEKLAVPARCSATLTLNFETRQRSRFKTVLDDGREAGVWLPRGGVLRDGDCLLGEDGTTVVVRAAAEAVSTGRTADAMKLTEAAYHLGNRHVALQLGDGWLRYAHDHVLDAMLASLGLTVAHELVPFEPLSGAYSSHAHGHSHVLVRQR